MASKDVARRQRPRDPGSESDRLLVLSTVGTSLLTSNVPPELQQYARALRVERANARALDGAEQDVVEQIAARAEEMLAAGDVAVIREKSAELNGLYGMYGSRLPTRKGDHHVLITSDTALGKRCAELVKDHLLQHGQSVDIPELPGLTTADTASFEKGCKQLIHWCAENIPKFRADGYHVLFNLVGGFKALPGFLNTIGMFYADEILYVFEGRSGALVRIPRLPITIDLESLRPFGVPLAVMAEGDAGVPIVSLAGLSRALYDEFDAGDAMISSWGLLVWQQIRDEVLKPKLLDFPRLRYEDSFRRDFKGASDAERVVLQQTLAKVAALLEENNGDTGRLKSDGGLRYGNLQNKTHAGKPIGHFRLAQDDRVSCIAENGELLLRRFGRHDDVENNP